MTVNTTPHPFRLRLVLSLLPSVAFMGMELIHSSQELHRQYILRISKETDTFEYCMTEVSNFAVTLCRGLMFVVMSLTLPEDGGFPLSFAVVSVIEVTSFYHIAWRGRRDGGEGFWSDLQDNHLSLFSPCFSVSFARDLWHKGAHPFEGMVVNL